MKDPATIIAETLAYYDGSTCFETVFNGEELRVKHVFGRQHYFQLAYALIDALKDQGEYEITRDGIEFV